MKRVLATKTLGDGYFLVRIHYKERDMLYSRIAHYIHARITQTNAACDPLITVAEVRPVARSRAKNLTAHGKTRRS